MNLPTYLRHHPWYAITLAQDDVARVQLASTPDAVVAWSLLIPLFDTLLAPIRQRAAGSVDPPHEQQPIPGTAILRLIPSARRCRRIPRFRCSSIVADGAGSTEPAKHKQEQRC